MKTRTMIFTAIAALALGACASTPAPSPSASYVDLSPSQQYIRHVENKAKVAGGHVAWVNPPRDHDVSKYVTENGR